MATKNGNGMMETGHRKHANLETVCLYDVHHGLVENFPVVGKASSHSSIFFLTTHFTLSFPTSTVYLFIRAMASDSG